MDGWENAIAWRALVDHAEVGLVTVWWPSDDGDGLDGACATLTQRIASVLCHPSPQVRAEGLVGFAVGARIALAHSQREAS